MKKILTFSALALAFLSCTEIPVAKVDIAPPPKQSATKPKSVNVAVKAPPAGPSVSLKPCSNSYSGPSVTPKTTQFSAFVESLPFDRAERVADGEVASSADAKGVVSISAGGFNCTGSLIGDRWVLTAAHCAFDYNTQGEEIGAFDRATVRVGGTSRFDGKNFGGKFYCHEGYDTANSSPINDIALIYLDNPASNHTKMPLVKKGDKPLGQNTDRIAMTILGFGFTAYDPDAPSVNQGGMSLMKGTLNLLKNPVECATSSSALTAVTFCSRNVGPGKKPSSMCKGDSGGPLLADPNGSGMRRQFGVNSFMTGKKCGEPGSASGFVDLRMYLDWIERSTGLTL